MLSMKERDYGLLRQEDGYLSGVHDKVGLQDKDVENTWEMMMDIAHRWHITFIHKRDPSIDDINSRLVYMIQTFENMSNDYVKKIIMNYIEEIHIRQGEQRKAWELEYNDETKAFDNWAQNKAEQLMFNIDNLMDLNQYLWVLNDDLDKDKQYQSIDDLDKDDQEYEYCRLYDQRGNEICDKIVEYLQNQL